jgi:hypothetical protein
MGGASGDEDFPRKLNTAKSVWSLLRSTVEKLAMAGGDQIKDPEIDECFDWDPSYFMLERCEELGWISAELGMLLSWIDAFLDQLSDDPRFWSDQDHQRPTMGASASHLTGSPSLDARGTLGSGRIARVSCGVGADCQGQLRLYARYDRGCAGEADEVGSDPGPAL